MNRQTKALWDEMNLMLYLVKENTRLNKELNSNNDGNTL